MVRRGGCGLYTVLIHDTWLEKSPSNSQPSRSLPLFGTPKALTMPRDFCHDCTRIMRKHSHGARQTGYTRSAAETSKPILAAGPAVRDYLGLKETDVTAW